MGDMRNDIEKYLRGELSPAEMHALEKKALSDPFLADALEGATTLAPNDFAGDLKALRADIHGQKKTVVRLWPWIGRIAAGITIVGIVAYLILSKTSTSTDRIAQNKVSEKKDGSPRVDTVEVLPKSELPSESLPADRSNQDRIASRQAPARTGEQSAKPSGPAKSEDASEIETFAESEIASGIQSQSLPLKDDAAAASFSADSIEPLDKMVSYISSEPKKIITGTVIDAEDGRPLPGVNVTLAGTTIGAITNEEGIYKIVADSLESGLLFSYIGYEERKVDAGASNSVDVVLNPDVAQLSEVVVVGYGGTKRDDMDVTPIIEIAEPAGGRRAYRQYLEQNLKYPEQALNNKVEGRVTVQFTVEATGQMTNFKVLKGLGSGTEDEVIRLIREGPKWKPTRKNTEAVADKVKVRLKFTLPKK
jgi:TonB family protein